MIRNIFIIFKMLGFLLHRPSANTVLVAELNTCHGELLHSWIKYLTDSGKKVELLLNKEVYNELLPFDDELKKVRMYPFVYRFYKLMFTAAIIRRYQKVIFNSEYIYPAGMSFFQLLGHLKAEQDRIIAVTHDMNEPLCCTAARIGLWERKLENFTPVSFQYYGDLKIVPEDFPVKQFVVVGGDNPSCRNMKLLYPVLLAMSPEKRKEIRITVVGFKIPEIPEQLKDVFDLKGRCSYQELYQILRNCYAIFVLLDPENADHLRYCSGVVSGNINLSFGFCRPAVLESQFAGCYGITDQTGFVHQGNNTLADAVERALTVSPEEYLAMRKELKKSAGAKYADGLHGLQQML